MEGEPDVAAATGHLNVRQTLTEILTSDASALLQNTSFTLKA